jgi:hypothetical protein
MGNLVAFFLLIPRPAIADVVDLNNGVAMTGIVSEETKDSVKLQVGEGGYVDLDRSTVAGIHRQTAAENKRLLSGWRSESEGAEAPAEVEKALAPESAPDVLTLYEGRWLSAAEMAHTQKVDDDELGTGPVDQALVTEIVHKSAAQATTQEADLLRQSWSFERRRIHDEFWRRHEEHPHNQVSYWTREGARLVHHWSGGQPPENRAFGRTDRRAPNNTYGSRSNSSPADFHYYKVVPRSSGERRSWEKRPGSQ